MEVWRGAILLTLTQNGGKLHAPAASSPGGTTENEAECIPDMTAKRKSLLEAHHFTD
jgi:hypothetical protein